jgi:molybdenum cofactor cytidylyltransferase
VNVAQVDRLNDVDESITLATLSPWQVVAKGDMVATVKIIPFAVEAEIFARAMAMLEGPLVSVTPFVLSKVGMISTILRRHALVARAVRGVVRRPSGISPLVSLMNPRWNWSRFRIRAILSTDDCSA